MAITERIDLDFGDARRQLERLEAQLDQIRQPIRVPVNITGDEAIGRMRRDFRGADDAVEDLNRELGRTERELRQVDRQADQTGDAMLRVGTRGVSAFTNLRGSLVGVLGAFGAIQGARAFLSFAGAAVSAASDLEESTSKATVVFGEFNDEIQAFARTGPQALGLSNAAALEFTATFGNLFVALGLSQQAAADLSPEIVQLGADLASFNNITVDEALTALRSGLVGEAEPLRRLGVNINVAVVEAKALELGLADTTGVVSEAAKVQARYALILEQTTTAQGDFARTADGIANRQRTLNAEFENFRAEVGEALLPAFEALLTVAPNVIEALRELVPAVQQAAVGFAENTDSIVGFVEGLGDVLRVLPGVLGGIGDVGGFLAGVGDGANALVRFDIAGAFDEWTAAGERFNSLVIDEKIDKLRTGLVNLLRDGIDPLEALNRQLVGLSQLDLDLSQLRDLTTQFAQIANVDTGGLASLSREIAANGAAAGLTADEISVMLRVLQELAFEQEKFARRAPGAGRRSAFEDEAIAALTEADALGQLEAAAQSLDITLVELLNDQSKIPEELDGVVGSLSASTIEYLRQVDAIDALDVAIGALPGAMEAAAAALRDEQGEIVEDFDTFFSNLTEQLAEREAFESNLAILRALGLDDLAAVFDAAGLEAAAALADAVSDPTKAAEAERKLDGQYVGVGEGLVDDIREGIEATGQEIDTALIQNIIDAAAAADVPEVRAALLRLAEDLRLEIPVRFQAPEFFSPEAGRARSGGSSNVESPGGGLTPQGVTVNINNPTTQDLSTDAARAASTISAVSRAR